MRLTKTFPASYSVKDDGDAGWEIEGYASVFESDAPDAYGDIVFKGAFAKTIKERVPAGKVRFFFDHSQVLGVPLSVEEDDTGLKVRARISKTTLGHDVRTLLADGAISDLSIGYDLVGDKNEPNTHGGLNLREVRLFEFSLVGLGAQDEAMVGAVKSMRDEQVALRAELANLRKAIPEPPEKPPEENGMEIEVGSFVSWGSDSEDAPIGKVVSLHTDGPVPDIEAEVEGTEDEPAAKIQVYEKGGADGDGWKPTEKHVGHKVSTLTVVEKPEAEEDPGKAAEDVPAEDEEGEAPEVPTAAEVRAALKTLQALVDAYEEPSKDTLGQDNEPPKDNDAELEKSLRAELDAMKSI